jgi:DNA transformation protein and related proteins
MPGKSEFVDHLVESLQPLGEVSARAMFGGWGFYLDGRMFALVADEVFYIKADDVSRPEFASRGLEPFRYEAKGKVNSLSYFQPPSEALDDRALLCEWAGKGVEAAARAAKAKRPARGRSRET